MSDTSDKRSSLDPELLRILEAAQAGSASELLDDAPLVDINAFDENATLVPNLDTEAANNEDLLAKIQAQTTPPPTAPVAAAPPPPQVPKFGEAERNDDPRATNSEVTHSVADLSPTEHESDISWFAEEPPLTQAMLDDMFAAAERRASESVSVDSLTSGEVVPGSGLDDSSLGESTFEDDAPMSQADLDALLAGGSAKPAAESTFEDDAPMSQTDLDALLAGEAATTPASAPEDDAPMPQADLDALLAGEAATTPASAPEDDAPMSQAELDALLAGEATTTPASAPEDDAPMSQAELDALLAGEATTTPASAPEDDAPMSQAELDALLAGGSAKPAAENTFEDDAPMSQADLDALLAGETAKPAAESTFENDAPMSQADLDALLAGETAKPAAESTFEDDAPMSQAELDALLAGEATTTPASAPEDDAPMSQAELDALLAGGSATTPASTPEDDAPMSQADLDALLAGETAKPAAESTFEDDAPKSQADLDALLAGKATTTPASAPEYDAPMSQADLDALLGGMDMGATEPADDGPLSQADLDALLGGIDAGATAPAPAPADDGPLSQNDLDALLGGLDNATKSPEPTASGPALLSQADLDALLAAEASGHERSLSQEALDALVSAATEKTPAEAPSSERPLALSQADLDALLAGSASDAPVMDRALDQANIDALLSGSGDEQLLDHRALDGSLGDFGEAYDDDISLSRSSIDSLMADLDSSGMLGAPPDSVGGEEDDDEISEISQDMIDSLIANAQSHSSGSSAPAAMSEIGSENFAAAATVSRDSGPELLSQSDLDRLIEESRQQDKARSQAKQRALEDAINSAQSAARSGGAPDLLAEIQAVKQRAPRKPSPTLDYLRDNAARVAASLLMGGLAAMGTAVLLHVNREVVRDASSPQASPELEVALERARDYVTQGNYPAAIAELERPVARAMPGATKNDALYVLLEAKYRSRPGDYGTDAFDDMTAAIDSTVAAAPTHARAPEALAWRAQMFAKDDPKAALDTYDRIFDQYAEAPGLDKMLLDASKLALAQNDPLSSAIYAQDLLRRFPASEFAGEAILAVGDANLIAGNEADARSTFVRIAQSEPDTGLGAQAFMRLGKLAYDTGQYGQAIMQLEKRLETTTTTDGNDEVYLLLAQSYRKAGQLNEARDTLNDLLNIFEPGPVTPRAYIEYSQVLEALGDREKAVRTAQRAAMEYPNDPVVLRNNGELLGLSGNPFAAADALVAADDAGAADPNLLLTAARYYRTANMPEEAAEIYERVKVNYGGSPAALAGGVEAAQLRYAEGDAEGALDDLEALQAATRGSEHYLATLRAMQEIYQDLGLTEHIRSLGKEIVQQAQAPDLLAETAINLIDAGDLESAQRAIESIDLAKLQESVAFNLLMKEGTALLAVAPQRGLEKMEEAHFNYPEARTREADQLLLRTYLDTGRPAAARRLVMELKSAVAEKPSDTPYLVDAAIAWGDYLYEKEDYRTAVFAYTLAEEAGADAGQPVAGLRGHPDWAQYQRANALLRLADYQGCIALYDVIATSDSTWAGEAAVKAGLARLEQRQRGIEVPLPTQAQAPDTTPAG